MADGGPNYISWNLANWVTIVLMAALGMALVGLAYSLVKNISPAADNG